MKILTLLLIICSFALQSSQQIELPPELWGKMLWATIVVDANNFRQELSDIPIEEHQNYMDAVMLERHKNGYLGFSPTLHGLCQAHPRKILAILKENPFFIKDMRELFFEKSKIYLSDDFFKGFCKILPKRESYPEHQIYTVLHNYVSFQNPDPTIEFCLLKWKDNCEMISKIPLGWSLLRRNNRFFLENRANHPGIISDHTKTENYENIAEIFYSPYIKDADRKKHLQQFLANENLTEENKNNYILTSKFNLLQENLKANPANKLFSIIFYVLTELIAEYQDPTVDKHFFLPLLKPNEKILIFYLIKIRGKRPIHLYFCNEIKQWLQKNSPKESKIANLDRCEKIEKNREHFQRLLDESIIARAIFFKYESNRLLAILDYLWEYKAAIDSFVNSDPDYYFFKETHFDQLVDNVELFFTVYDKGFNRFAQEQLLKSEEKMIQAPDDFMAKVHDKITNLKYEASQQKNKIAQLTKDIEILKIKNTNLEKVLGLIKKCFIIAMIFLPVIFVIKGLRHNF